MDTGLDVIDKLIAYWRNDWNANEADYLTVIIPGIVRSDGSVQLTKEEKRCIPLLQRLLSAEEWAQLPTLIAQRRAGQLKALSSDQAREMERKEVALRAAEERARIEAIEKEQVARKKALLLRIREAFASDFLGADKRVTIDPDVELLNPNEYSELKQRFVQDWALREHSQPLDPEQAAAVAAIEGDVQVVARAGSGKTRTLTTRAIFLQKHCRVSPHALLLLAFNKKAAEEMRSRLAEALGTDLPHAMTFHALAYALAQPEDTLLFDDVSADQFGLSYEVQEVIDEHIRSTEYRGRIRDLMLAHFREDWERIEGGQFQLTMDEFLAYRRALPRESLKGDYVKSFGERIIANTLFEYGIEYRYERNFRWDDSNYRPDFTIPIGAKGGVVIEYFGLEGDADYDDMSQRKRQFWDDRPEWQFVEFSPNDLLRNGTDGFVRTLLGILSKRRIPCRRRSEEEIWELIKRRAVDGFTAAMKNFIGRCRRSNLTPESLELMVAKHTCSSTAETLFLEIAVSVYRGYLQRIAACQKEDFDGLIWRSVSLIRNGQTTFVRDRGRERGDVAQLRFVMIDEFQDFSPMFFELVAAIRAVNPNVQFFCVGDDWQAINGFAGSDLCFFDNFGTYFQGASRCFLRTNYRSPRSVVEVGNALMHRSGPAAKPERNDIGVLWLCNLDEFKPSAQEMVRHNGDEVTPAILRMVSHLLAQGLDVVMLSRRHNLPWYVNYNEVAVKIANPLERFEEHIRSYLPEEDRERITVSTVHQFKGLEQSAVIILDAVKRSYPLLHPHWVFLRVFGNDLAQIEAEERRLFYVAVTRSQNALAFVTEARVETAFLDDIRRHIVLPTFVWADLPPVLSLDDTHLEIRVFNAYHVRDQLKRMNYQWNSADKYWYRAVRAEGFTLATLLKQPWVRANVTIEIYDELGNLIDTGMV